MDNTPHKLPDYAGLVASALRRVEALQQACQHYGLETTTVLSSERRLFADMAQSLRDILEAQPSVLMLSPEYAKERGL